MTGEASVRSAAGLQATGTGQPTRPNSIAPHVAFSEVPIGYVLMQRCDCVIARPDLRSYTPGSL